MFDPTILTPLDYMGIALDIANVDNDVFTIDSIKMGCGIYPIRELRFLGVIFQEYIKDDKLEIKRVDNDY